MAVYTFEHRETIAPGVNIINYTKIKASRCDNGGIGCYSTKTSYSLCIQCLVTEFERNKHGALEIPTGPVDLYVAWGTWLHRR